MCKRMAVISAGFVPVPAVDGGAGEVLTTEIISGNETKGDYYMDVYTIESSKLDAIKYNHAEIIQLHISKWNWFICKARNAFLKLFQCKYRFIPYNRALLRSFRDNYDIILIENNMQVYHDIYKHATKGTNCMIYHMHNDIDGTTKPEYLCRYIAKTAKYILPVSNYIKRSFEKAAPNDKMHVFYNCIDFALFDVEKRKYRQSLREKYGIKDEEFVYLYSGRVCPEKGVLEIVRAFKEVCRKKSNIRLMIVGSRWYHLIDKDEYFEQIIRESQDVEEKIIFTGYIEPQKMPEIYGVGDTLLIPTLCEEAFCMSALEGMSMRMPIVATNSGGMMELLDEETAIIINKEENIVEQLEKAMTVMLEDEKRRNDFAEKAYEKATSCKEFHKDNYYDNFIKIIKQTR